MLFEYDIIFTFLWHCYCEIMKMFQLWYVSMVIHYAAALYFQPYRPWFTVNLLAW